MKKKLTLKMSSKSLEEGFKEFIKHCRVKNLSPRTIDFYEECFNKFSGSYNLDSQINNITSNVIDDYILYLRDHTSFNSISINSMLRGLGSILYYFMKLDYLEKHSISLIKQEKKIKEIYSDSELQRLIMFRKK